MQLNTTLSDAEIEDTIRKGVLSLPDSEILDDEEKKLKLIQPASFDPRPGERAWLLEGSIKPNKDEKVKELIHTHAKQEIDLRDGHSLNTHGVYIVELQESYHNDDPSFSLRSNSKSSSGRIDLQTRLMGDGVQNYDLIEGRYDGKLYLEVTSNSFHTFLQTGTPLNQLRFSKGNPIMSDSELHTHILNSPILFTKEGKHIPRKKISLDDGLVFTIDLNSDIVGYKAKKTGLEINLQELEHDENYWKNFFEEIGKPKDGLLTVEPDNFYLFSTNEAVSVPPAFAGELKAVDPRAGNFTAHYAGFFDPGFGYKKKGNTTTLEVRVHNRPEVFRDGQRICVLQVERLSRIPENIYGSEKRDSIYERQTGVGLSKYVSSNKSA